MGIYCNPETISSTSITINLSRPHRHLYLFLLYYNSTYCFLVIGYTYLIFFYIMLRLSLSSFLFRNCKTYYTTVIPSYYCIFYRVQNTSFNDNYFICLYSFVIVVQRPSTSIYCLYLSPCTYIIHPPDWKTNDYYCTDSLFMYNINAQYYVVTLFLLPFIIKLSLENIFL